MMRKVVYTLAFALGVAVAPTSAPAQMVISAKAGVIHYVEGKAFNGSDLVETKFGGKFADVKENTVFRTEEGRAEILLNPGVFLRLPENSSFRMISSRLIDTRLELLTGSALIEVADASKESSITLLVKDQAITFRKTGIVRADVDKGISVYKGEVQLTAEGAKTVQILKEGREFLFEGDTVARFDNKETDELFRWSSRRAEYLAMANIASANMMRKSGGGSFDSGWIYNPYYGMITFLPSGSIYRSPFGYVFYSPGRVHGFLESYTRAPSVPFDSGRMDGQYNRDLGYATNSRVGMASAPVYSGAGAAAGAAAAPVARGAETGTSRGGSAGGRSR